MNLLKTIIILKTNYIIKWIIVVVEKIFLKFVVMFKNDK